MRHNYTRELTVQLEVECFSVEQVSVLLNEVKNLFYHKGPKFGGALIILLVCCAIHQIFCSVC